MDNFDKTLLGIGLAIVSYVTPSVISGPIQRPAHYRPASITEAAYMGVPTQVTGEIHQAHLNPGGLLDQGKLEFTLINEQGVAVICESAGIDGAIFPPTKLRKNDLDSRRVIDAYAALVRNQVLSFNKLPHTQVTAKGIPEKGILGIHEISVDGVNYVLLKRD